MKLSALRSTATAQRCCSRKALPAAAAHAAPLARARIAAAAAVASPARAAARRAPLCVRASAQEPPRPNGGGEQQQQQPREVVYNTEFGYSRKDVLVICAAVLGVGCAMYYGLQAAGMDAGMAGNWVQLTVVLGLCVGWVSTYIYRVATKQMTYVKQLEAYEEAVMRKRLEEMTDGELDSLLKEVEDDKSKGAKRPPPPQAPLE